MAEQKKPHDAEALEAGYARWHRIYETSVIVCASTAWAWLVLRIMKSGSISGWWMPLAALLGLLAADFVSGFFHWVFDTWGGIDTPIFGRVAIRTFRHHHVDDKAITRHDFIETNGHNFGLTLPVALVTAYSVHPDDPTFLQIFVGTTIAIMLFFVWITSQIHKWAHLTTPPPFIAFLQRTRLILSPEHHQVHHVAPHTRNYCITVGWMNGPLRAIRFFETSEWIISAVTGAVPREDDLGKEVALEVANELETEEEPAPEPIRIRD